MNLNKEALTVLCFGDSNTYGLIDDSSPARFDRQTRWTGVLQAALGEDYEILEEGMPRRTFGSDGVTDCGSSLHGRDYFGACLESSLPLDAILLSLGTNDVGFVEANGEITEEVHGYAQVMHDLHRFAFRDLPRPSPAVVLMSPVPIDTSREARFSGLDLSPEMITYNEKRQRLSEELTGPLAEVARQYGWSFVDLARDVHATVGEDGLHLDRKSHHAVGTYLAPLIRSLHLYDRRLNTGPLAP